MVKELIESLEKHDLYEEYKGLVTKTPMNWDGDEGDDLTVIINLREILFPKTWGDNIYEKALSHELYPVYCDMSKLYDSKHPRNYVESDPNRSTIKKLNAKQILQLAENNFSKSEWGYGEEAFTVSVGQYYPSTDSENTRYLNLLPEEIAKLADLDYAHRKLNATAKTRDKEFWDKMDKLNPYKYLEDIFTKELGLGKVEIVDSYGGEDMGSEWWNVRYFEDHDIYIKVSGYYSSYHGTDFDDYGFEVEPFKKAITDYKKK